jgi:nucleoside-diphosphate-sugar epimerase
LAGLTLVTGAAGYLGALVCRELLAGGRPVRGVDVLRYGQRDVAEALEREGIEVLLADLRDRDARARALEGVEAVVHLAAIVGDPACAREPQASHEVNVELSRALIGDARRAEVRRLVFASTCSNYGRMADSTVPIDERAPLAPISLYARQKVHIETELITGNHGLATTCLRFATVYGVAPRMRFDLTVNEFTRDLWADRVLEVFGEQFWRPYIHVHDAARATRVVLDSPEVVVGGQVFNVGSTAENYRKVDIVQEIRRQLETGTVRYVSREEDPRDYKVSFERIRNALGYSTQMTVPDGIAETIAALRERRFADPFDPRHLNVP